jgi:hypothetical protein
MMKKLVCVGLIYFVSIPFLTAMEKEESLSVVEPEKKDLYVVVGSRREKKKSFKFIDGFYGEKEADLTHSHTCGGQVVTLDLKGSKSPSSFPHWEGDAINFDFSPYLIKFAYLERLPTYDMRSVPTEGKEEFYSYNILGACVDHMARSMAPGALLHIEWAPDVVFLHSSQQVAEKFNKNNPFCGYFNRKLLLGSLEKAFVREKEFSSHLEDRKRQKMYVKKLRKSLAFVARVLEVPTQQLKQRVRKEWSTFNRLCLNTDSFVLLGRNRFGGWEDFKEAYENAAYGELDNFKMDEVKSHIYEHGSVVLSYDSFLQGSFICFLCSQLVLSLNHENAMAFLKANGFEDVIFKVTTSPWNKRKNIGLLKGVRTDHPL